MVPIVFLNNLFTVLIWRRLHNTANRLLRPQHRLFRYIEVNVSDIFPAKDNFADRVWWLTLVTYPTKAWRLGHHQCGIVAYCSLSFVFIAFPFMFPQFHETVLLFAISAYDNQLYFLLPDFITRFPYVLSRDLPLVTWAFHIMPIPN